MAHQGKVMNMVLKFGSEVNFDYMYELQFYG